MLEQPVQVPTSDGTADGFLFLPSSQNRSPAVIYLTDIGGIRSATREAAKRLVSDGFAVLLPNIFYRTTRPPVMPYPLSPSDPALAQRMTELRAPLTPDAIERDASAYIDFLSSHQSVSPAPVGVVGYCFSGSFALRFAAARPDKIAAAASFHGVGLYTDRSDSPHTLLPRVKGRLYFAHAVQDRSMPKEAIEKLEAALAVWGGRYESETYEGAFHSWTTTDSPVYNQPQAERAYAKLLDLLRPPSNKPSAKHSPS